MSVRGLRDHGAYLSALKCRMGIVSNQWMILPRELIRGGLKSAARKVQPLYWLRVDVISRYLSAGVLKECYVPHCAVMVSSRPLVMHLSVGGVRGCSSGPARTTHA